MTKNRLRGKDRGITPGAGTTGSYVPHLHSGAELEVVPAPAPKFGSFQEELEQKFDEYSYDRTNPELSNHDQTMSQWALRDAEIRAGVTRTEQFDLTKPFTADMYARVQYSAELSSARTEAESREDKLKADLVRIEREIIEAKDDQLAFLILFRMPDAASIDCRVLDWGRGQTSFILDEVRDLDGKPVTKPDNWEMFRQDVADGYWDGALPNTSRWAPGKGRDQVIFTF